MALHVACVGEAALRHASLDDRAQAVLQALAHETGETASLAMIDGAAVRIARRAEPDGVLKAKLHVGDTLTLDGSASGRVLAAFLPEARVALLARRGGQLPGAAVLREVNQRLSMVYHQLRKMPDEQREALRQQAAQVRGRIDSL